MRRKDIDLFDRLADSIGDRSLVNRFCARRRKLKMDERGRFAEYLLETFPPDELARVMEYFLTLGPGEWNDIAGRRTGEDVYDHGDRLTAIIENLASDSRAYQPGLIPDDDEPEIFAPVKFLRLLRLHDLRSFALTATQRLILKFSLLVFDHGCSKTGKSFGLSRQGVRDAARHMPLHRTEMIFQ